MSRVKARSETSVVFDGSAGLGATLRESVVPENIHVIEVA
jgi:hypothetical protein